MTTSRERINNAINCKSVDKLPVRIYAAPGGYYAHGEKLHELLCACGHDFGPAGEFSMPDPIPPEDYDADGNYHAKQADEWGVEWEYLIPGIQGHPSGYPLESWDSLGDLKVPPFPDEYTSGINGTIEREAELRKEYYRIGFAGTFFERMSSLRRFDDILVDIELGDPNAEKLADLLFARGEEFIKMLLKVGYDSVFIGDDFGTSMGPLLSPDTWRRFFFPRYKKMLDIAHAGGKDVFMHSCGSIDMLLPGYREMGVDVLWPQITNWEMKELATRAKDIGLCLELHPDRGDLMHHGTAGEVRDYIKQLIDTFKVYEGGSWLYIEIEPGFKWETTEALVTEVMAYR